MGDFLSNLGKSASNLVNSAGKEAQRVVDEARRHVTESIDEVAKQTEKGGFVMGVATAIDKVSPGNLAAGVVDSIIPGEDLPQPVADGISAGVNLVVSTAFPPLQLLAVVDAFQAVGGLMASNPPAPAAGAPAGAEAGQRMQTPESPQSALERAKEAKQEARAEARKQAIEEAKARAREAAREKAQNNKIADLEARVSYLEELAGVTGERVDAGYAPGGMIGGGVGDSDGFISNDFFGPEIGNKGGAPKTDRMKRLERDLKEAEREIDKILSNPNLSFEDMIFLLMRAVIKQSESEVKLSLEEEKGTRDGDRAFRDAGRNEINGMQGELNKLNTEAASLKPGEEKDKKLAAAAELRSQIEVKQTKLTDRINDRTESRSERMEELKESLQKVSEMQQALSNILNTLHQTAMNAIGNIR